VRGHLIGYRPAPGTLRGILRAEETYLLQRTNGLLIAGASTENAGFDRRIDPKIVADLVRRAEALLPALRTAGTPEAWLGFRPRSDAHRPIIGRHGGSNLWLAYGHFRNGILLAPATAERVAAQITSSGGTD
jgi:glycine oxidase